MLINNPIINRELIGLLRTKKALAMLIATAAVFALLVVARWPTNSVVGRSGAQSRQVFQLFGYGLLTLMILMVPVFPATSIVHERIKGTMALLLNSPMRPLQIYLGKLIGVMGFVILLLLMSVPAAAACYVMGGLSFTGDVSRLYGVLALACLQLTTLGLLVSTYSNSTDSALRMTFGFVLIVVVIALIPNFFFQGTGDVSFGELGTRLLDFSGAIASFDLSKITNSFGSALMGLMKCVGTKLRFFSPIPAVMEILGHADLTNKGLIVELGAPFKYMVYSGLSILLFAYMTIRRLNYSMFDRSRAAGVITDDRTAGQKAVRRAFFLVDPQRRKNGIGPLTNPVMVKEFRCRKFGRSHWLMRIVAATALISLGLTFLTTTASMDWGVESIGGIIVVLQMAIIGLFTPSLAAGLISSERESGGWDLLRMTPMSAMKIVRGKLMSVVWTLLMVLAATLPGYLVMVWIKPSIQGQVIQVMICLILMSVFAVFLSAAASSLFKKTATATTVAYGVLLIVCAGTLLIWLGRDAPFGHATVERALSINPMAAALSVIQTPGFTQYNLLPTNWWVTGAMSLILLTVLVVQTIRLTRPR
ncbi:MAG: ABC transporter permease [Mariniblastus sp.]|nr:ABC transporter permease [Mariniblastus sp.]